jgi:hypothetical protein
MKIHPRAEHMRVHDKNFLAIWTSDFNGLTHGLPRYILDFGFSILDFGLPESPSFILPRKRGRKEVGVALCALD